MNLNILDDNIISSDYINVILENGFKQLITEPTRITTTTSTLIDHFIKNSLTDYARIENVQIADHKLIRLPFYSKEHFKNSICQKARCYKFLSN